MADFLDQEEHVKHIYEVEKQKHKQKEHFFNNGHGFLHLDKLPLQEKHVHHVQIVEKHMFTFSFFLWVQQLLVGDVDFPSQKR